MAADVVTQIITARITEHVAESPFYIPMTGPAARPRRSLKHDDTFIVLDSHGDIGASAGGPDGLFNADTRYLARLEMVLEDVQPLLLGSNMRDDNSALTVDLTNSDVYRDGRLTLQKDTLHIVRSIFLWRGTAYQRIGLQNHGEHIASFDLTLLFDNDFADLFEVRGERRPRRGIGSSKLLGPTDVVLEYCGLDEQTRITALHFDPRPTRLSVNTATYHFDLEPGHVTSLFVAVSCNKPIMHKPVPFFRGLLAHRREMRSSTAGAASIETSNNIFNEVLCQAMADLNMLMTETPQGRYPYAGIPWYSTTFGRDGLITALQMLWVDPRIAKGVLKRLALFQAKVVDPLSDAAPGKILHEMRGGEMAALREVPFAHYYGSVDSTPLFVLLAGLYLERTGDLETLRELWPAVEAGLQWIDGPGDPDRDGFVEYQRATEEGLRNQGWKDSFDAIFHADGSLAEGNIALAEVQGYVFAGKQLAARAARKLGFADQAARLDAEAERLRERFEAAFWCEELGTYALALDGAKRPCKVRTSNAGQTLFSGMVREDRARRVAADLMSQRFFSGWGIRTVAVGEARYNPMSYHDGSIWPHDNALIALGFARYGLKHSVAHLFKGLFDAASYMELRRLPELFCGFRRERRRGPVLYPVACVPQAWASATPFTLLEAALGLEFDTTRGEIRLRDPRLPEFLNDVVLRDLRLGASSVDLRLRRHDGEVSLEVLRTRGQIQVSIVLTH
ncbi:MULTISPECIES: amylo-alpha-1,6-glucosidase [unclassified Bradyrhizobium]|uniref:amylo-alpha-1,6-glucosidase n=1 Tax=unclassified Bradyrhizobium TaxID=2631580 RepID=UPI001BA52BFB|nr:MULTISPECIES: amylo-alpha-1,6-glucosidase [unclassified Bradyrhizobium]MBR1202023.1 amylo-alpha-1,6-glucosidase [Bradyrhizobium sp. AUGA SZCCT0124]MBR1311408.1 amylo-alpha-1,6-glucosidase [Bradyrhizobium sp. AUGA SZCCT0051]MBR1338972.1 amylo-alpha-1,6-glucosidase [Bradyrhizobium sp. AUGA SZCCT0105]MBR1353546.1 amylo-alpha-1,6-glucosidase [Bradyrhizobium sp. AUGA SZCCT0045]